MTTGLPTLFCSHLRAWTRTSLFRCTYLMVISFINRQDSDLNIIEDHDWTQITPISRKFKFHKANKKWCTRCFLHFLVVAEEADIYYFTAEPRNKETVIYDQRDISRVVNRNTQDCFEFYVDKEQEDLVVTLQTYEGVFDFFIKPRTLPPTNARPDQVALYSAQGYSRRVILSSDQRRRLGFKTGLFYLCAYAHTTSSFRIFANEFAFNRRFVVGFNQVSTFVTESNNYNYFVFRGKLNKFGYINVDFNATSYDPNQQYPRVFYKICPQQFVEDCSFSQAETLGNNNLSEVIGLDSTNTQVAIPHSPSSCPVATSCVYMFTVVNNSTRNVMTNIQFGNKNLDPQTMVINEVYANVKQIDTYEYYEFFITKDFRFIESVTIQLVSINGDADLFVSTVDRMPTKDSFEFQSRETEPIDQVKFVRPLVGTLASGYYIGVYANKYSVFNLQATITYTVNYNQKLMAATPIYNSLAQYQFMETEYEEEFYSFMPDWPASEPHVIGFHAQMIFNKVFFYLEHNSFPRHFLDALHDDNDFIIIRPGMSSYFNSGQYFIRLRPDFALYDLVSEREYIYNFFALTMPDEEWVTLYQNQSQAGFGNETDLHFKYYLDTQGDTYNITMEILTGDPIMMIKVSNTPVFGNLNDQESFDFQSDMKQAGWNNISINYDQRYGNEVDCLTSGYYLDGGNIECTLYITIRCDDWCAFNLTVRNTNDSMVFPSHLLNQKYKKDSVSFKEVNYYYFPLNQNSLGDMAIVLNKTQGNSFLFASLIPDTSKGPFSWNYPKSQQRNKLVAVSNEKNPDIPELIELCWRVPNLLCSTDDCALLIGVEGNSRREQSHYSLIVHGNDTKLNSTEPKRGWFNRTDEYHYYWFTQTKEETEDWQSFVAVNLFNKSDDVDLYLSFGDGRLPTKDDYDFKSNNLGADFIGLSSKNQWFMDNGRLSLVGIFVVGVHSKTRNTTYTLQTVQSVDDLVNPVQVFGDKPVTKTIKEGEKHYYKYFNWGYQDYQLFLKSTQTDRSAVYAYLSFQSDLDWQTTTLASIPTAPENSRWWGVSTRDQEIEQTFMKSNVLTFCYFCWYYLTIETNSTKSISYQVEFDVRKDTGSETIQIPLNQNRAIQLPATNSIDIKKFMLTSKDDFVIKASLQTGFVDMVVGLSPERIESNFLWKSQGGIGTVSIKVSQAEENFYAGTFYFVHIRSRQGSSSLQLQIEQDQRVTELVDGVTVKDQFMTIGEQVKFYAFKLPSQRSYSMDIKVNPLSPYFVPLVFVEQVTQVQAINDFGKLVYPTIVDFDQVYGNETLRIVDDLPVEVSFTNTSAQNSAVVISVYNFVHGLTDLRKPEFEIVVTIGNSVLKAEQDLPVTPGSMPKYTLADRIQEKLDAAWARVFNWIDSLTPN